MNRLYPLLAAMLCVAPLAVAEQTPCSELPLDLVVLVEESGQTEREAVTNLAREAPAVVESIDTPCVTKGEVETEPYTDGAWRAFVELRVSGQEGDLRDIAASLDGAEPVRLDGSAFSVLGDGMSVGAAAGAVAGVVACAVASRKGFDVVLFGLVVGVVVFGITATSYITWVEVSWASVGAG